MIKKLLSLYIILLALFTNAQELPPIVKFSASNYNAGNQNWMISQDKSRFMYFANNEGLLEYNGTEWTLYPSPNETIVRSVKVIEKRIYTGCYMEFGYWERQQDGKLKYFSLSQSIKNKILDDEQFWNITQYDHWVIFQSLSQIFIYDSKNKSFNIIKPETGVNKIFSVNNKILYQTFGTGLYEIENGKSKLVSANPVITGNKIVSIYDRNEALLIQTQLNGFYELKNNSVTKWTTEADGELQNSSIYSGQMLSNGSLALGSVSNGIYILNPAGKIKYHITQNKGLSNNTALSLYEDRDRNLWIGLDNGINCINLQSAVRSFVDDTGFLGTVYTSILHNGLLYIGTNQGLFYRNYTANEDFKFIPGTKGQVWSLHTYDNTLFCGHDSGTYIINSSKATRIFDKSGTWKFEKHPSNPNMLLQGNYHGISVLEKISGGWKFRNWIKGFDYSSRYFETLGKNDIYISHEYKGVFRIVTDKDYTKVVQSVAYKSPAKGKNASLSKFNNDVYYASKDGFFKVEPKTKTFVKQQQLSKVFTKDEYTSGKLTPDNSAKLWFFTRDYINYFSAGKLNAELKHNIIPIPSSLTNSMLGFENITQISPSTYLIGTTDGYYTININDLNFNTYNVSITNVTSNRLNQSGILHSINNEGSFKYKENNLTFSYTVPEYGKYVNAQFQYMLEGMQDEWSEWSGKPSANFKNLPSGHYVFRIRAKTGNSISGNIAEYEFTIFKPWYATNFALFIYLIFIIIAAYMINRTYKNYYQRQREKLIEENNRLLEIKELENEQELMKIKNQQLEQDFESKNRELAVSTMNLIKKNELLSMIKDDLKKNAEGGERNVKSVISTINKNINEDDTWDMFKEAFNNADKDFLKKVKNTHPSLTPNDLRLCAYLRLNLSSKEIAPLLNISVRSVEIKRYRLRKKMELSHELGLVEYILSI
ncbi:triple tyrosine motif-containing protein [Flavobacterium sp. AG291]|uniref:triple tyrosine motif-containing protein n=1 Tax=Flavobacterium sp. AG291 TaxID=2184000 RepID=UPI000E2C5497|nr:triple tyrosine motif-containing protein [Flavobacterium sp. AG291]RDI13253.1 two component regulator with propeller domain [Flavobacterium sp. AG291]